jgi:hypothetical protein
MTETDYPSEVTKDNFKQLNEKARTIKKRAKILLFATATIYSIIALAAMQTLLFAVEKWLWTISLPPLPAETSFVLSFVLLAIFLFLLLYWLIGIVEWSLMRAFKLPRHDERIFAECFIIADYLESREKRKAVLEVDDFAMHLYAFARSGLYRSREYAPEFRLLSNGKTAFRRMVLFSEQLKPELLRNFGLALVCKKDAEAFSILKEILSEVRKYGKLKGRLRRILGELEKYQNLLTLLLFIISVILVVLRILPSI